MNRGSSTCSICSEPIPLGAIVFLEKDGVAHLSCRALITGLTPVLRELLDQEADHRFCYTCLASRLHAEREQIEKAATALRLTPDYRVKPAECSGCGRLRVTIGAAARPAAAGLEPPVRHAGSTPGGPAAAAAFSRRAGRSAAC